MLFPASVVDIIRNKIPSRVNVFSNHKLLMLSQYLSQVNMTNFMFEHIHL